MIRQSIQENLRHVQFKTPEEMAAIRKQLGLPEPVSSPRSSVERIPAEKSAPESFREPSISKHPVRLFSAEQSKVANQAMDIVKKYGMSKEEMEVLKKFFELK